MDIVIAFNEEFVMPAGVMLCSLFENNKAEDIHIHALLSHNATFIQPIYDIVNQYGAQLHCYDMSLFDLPPLPLNLPNQRANISIESYYRLFASKILPMTLDRVLYLDCDIIIADSLKPLWDEDISGFAVGAIPDFENDNVKISNRLGYDVRFGYFNSGVLLINLKYWREHNVLNNFLDYINDHFNELAFHDQDILNHEFYQRKKELSIRYNFQTNFLYKNRFRNISCKYFDLIDEAYKNPCVIHYTEDKPWFSDTTNPMCSYFDKYQNMTIWKGHTKKQRKVGVKSKFRRIISLIKGKPKSEILYNCLYLKN